MPVNTVALMNALATLSEEENIRVCCSESLKGGLIAGASTIFGGLVLGPVGLAIGGTIGGVCAAMKSHGKFKPVAVVIREMTPHQQEQLLENLRLALKDVDVTDLALLLPLLTTDLQVKQLALQTVTNYLVNNMGLRIAS